MTKTIKNNKQMVKLNILVKYISQCQFQPFNKRSNIMIPFFIDKKEIIVKYVTFFKNWPSDSRLCSHSSSTGKHAKIHDVR